MDGAGASLGPAWGKVRMYRDNGPSPGCSAPAPTPGRLQVGPAEVPIRNGSWTSCHLQPFFLSAFSLLPRAGPETKLPSGWGGGKGRWSGQCLGPRS